MTITELVKSQQQQRIGELSRQRQGKPHVNPYGTPGMSLNDAEGWRNIVPVDEGVARQVKQIAFDHMKKGYGVSDGEDISKVIRDYAMSLWGSSSTGTTRTGTGGNPLTPAFWTAISRAWIR